MNRAHRILLIDDDITFLKSAALTLKEHAEIVQLSDPRECETVLTDCFDVIVTDYKMDFLDGIKILELAKHRCPNSPVILVSAYTSKEMAIRAANLHVFAILEKPLDYSHFQTTIVRALKAPKAPAAAQIRLSQFGDLLLDEETLSVEYKGTDCKLTDIEFRLLRYLISMPGRRISREEMIRAIWGGVHLANNVLDTHLSNLKRKLPVMRDRLQMIRGKGYIYTGEDE